MRALAFALALAACAARAPRAVEPEVDDPSAQGALLAARLAGYRAAFLITWNGARIGEAEERFSSAGDGFRFERKERIQVRRSGAVVTARTEIAIDVDENLVAQRVTLDRYSGPTHSRIQALRLVDDGWRVGTHTIDGAAVPAALVPLLVAAQGAPAGRAFSGTVLVEGASLAPAQLTVDISADRARARARTRTTAGELLAIARLDADGFIAAAGEAGRGVASARVAPEQLAGAFDPPEIVDSSSVPVTGSTAFAPDRPLKLRVEGLVATPPRLPDLPEQRVIAAARGWDVLVLPAAGRALPAARDALTEIRDRTHQVARALADDLGTFALGPDEAIAAGRGDCTAHALVLQAELERRGYPARLVTGFVYAGGALRRHRWVLVRLTRGWVAADPMLDEVPASPGHLALAIHDSDALAFIDDIAFHGWDGARARFVP